MRASHPGVTSSHPGLGNRAGAQLKAGGAADEDHARLQLARTYVQVRNRGAHGGLLLPGLHRALPGGARGV